jgi:hypothetical protein
VFERRIELPIQQISLYQMGVLNLGGSSDVNDITQRPPFIASLIWVKDNHTYKIGSSLDIYGYPAQNYSNTSGSYVFSQAQTGQPFQNTAVNGDALRGGSRRAPD